MHYVIVHGDFDGTVCGLLSRDAYPDCHVKFSNYPTLDDDIMNILSKINPEKDKLFVLDLCPSEKVLKTMHEKFLGFSKSLLLCDHHVSNQILKKYGWALHHEAQCAARVFYKYLQKNWKHKVEYNMWSLYADAWDRWLLNNKYREHAAKLEELRKFIGNRRFLARGLQLELSDKEKEILEVIEDKKDKHIGYHNNHFQKDGEVAILFVTRNLSLIAQKIFETHADIMAVVMFNTEYRTISLRSRLNTKYDMSVVAKSLGGGGHAGASGITMDNEIIYNLGKFKDNLLGKIKQFREIL